MDDLLSGTTLSPEILTKIISAQTAIVRQGQDLGAVMGLVADRLLELTGAGGSIVELAEGEEMVYRAVAGMARNHLGLRLNRKGSLSGMCVESGEILYCADSETDDRVDREACRKVGLRSMVVVPLFHLQTVVGVLKVASAQVAYFTAQHMDILRLVSELVASAMFFAAKNETDELYYRATHDSLTGLANRALFYDRLRQGIALAQRQESCLGIMNLDMDGLKSINDQYGHRAGDAAIRELGERVSRVSRQSDTVARLGGDEFAVILPEIQNIGNAEHHAARVESAVRQPFQFESTPLDITASIGIAIYPDDGTKIEDLLEKADQAMYSVKRERKGRSG